MSIKTFIQNTSKATAKTPSAPKFLSGDRKSSAMVRATITAIVTEVFLSDCSSLRHGLTIISSKQGESYGNS
ncbi:hypothetical protein QVD17_39161 [Tagetes erecta]|uniref:Uncharacterized protein n=1 Tax=Tagetes erecta TaxID=13708 RepID=A0AAD8JPI2_TARER|nr:hypothetical protein QVD17_39161 [Tagetes erecta]